VTPEIARIVERFRTWQEGDGDAYPSREVYAFVRLGAVWAIVGDFLELVDKEGAA
jgi:hypothetical protein